MQYREGVPDEDRRRLYQHARLSIAEMDAISSLVHLPVLPESVYLCLLRADLTQRMNCAGSERQGFEEETQVEIRGR